MRRYLHQARPVRGRVYQEVLYEPGEALPVDWGDCGRVTVGQTPRRVSVFVAVLCYSRLCYIEFSLCQRKAEFYRALVHALEFFQGSPRNRAFRDWGTIFDVDNTLATAMIDRLMHHGEAIVIRGDSYRMKDKPTE
ncbi:MAG: ATP-binding protein, partial [Thermoguttaceae bacterium]